jgi:hypothetical protein
VFGKRARWIDYWGKIDEKTVGIAIFDHPANPHHPTSIVPKFGWIISNGWCSKELGRMAH